MRERVIIPGSGSNFEFLRPSLQPFFERSLVDDIAVEYRFPHDRSKMGYSETTKNQSWIPNLVYRISMFTETLRLQIRDYAPEDFGAFALLMADPEVMRFSVRGPLSREEAWEHFQKRILDHYKTYGFGLWALVCKEEIIGFAGLITQEIDGEKKIELAYRILPKYWGQGLASEAVQAIFKSAFEEFKLKELVSIIDPANTRSLRLAERAGMRFLKKTQYHHLDVLIYARSNP